jgi:hypothetical protein
LLAFLIVLLEVPCLTSLLLLLLLLLFLLHGVTAELNASFADEVLSRVPKGKR